mmetsp:Transcript_1117/g.1122  ORF Transcript_1117/g.1122 Transcript_1117/m.1122 type:complete len:394 (+) Transcript_1117:51-1232(+)
MPRLEDWEIKKYWEIFQGLNPVDNKITGDKASTVLKNSRLKDEQLSQIWDLSDIDSDGKLDFEEFCITMRLIFDLVNGNQQSLPNELPSWLVPASKAHLIQANRAVTTGSNNYQSNNNSISDDYDEDETLSDDFDWYISPTDKSIYETIYNSNSDSYGRVKFDSLTGLYQTLSKVPRSDISSAWNLVNPKSFEAIDKDQVLVFLHMLNQRENGKRIPRYVPASLRATFSKDTPSYDLNQAPSKPISLAPESGKNSFANSYLNKIGQANNASNEKGTDFSATEGTDWEEVRLRRELANLEDLLSKASLKDNASNKIEDSELTMIKYEYEQLLKYKTNMLSELEAGSRRNNSKDLSDAKNDIELIENQVTILQEFLNERQNELNKTNEEIRALKT